MHTAPALLAISHGTDNADGRAAVERLVQAVAQAAPDLTVRLGHVDVQQPDVAASLAALGERPTVIVPLLLSAGYHVHVDLARATGHRDDVTVSAALGPDRRLVEVLAARIAEADADTGAAVVLAVAGSSDERANDDCRRTGELLAAHLGRPVSVGFLAAAEPGLAAAIAVAAASAPAVVIATYLLAPGYFHDRTVSLAAGRPVARPLLDAGPPAPALVDLVLERYRDAGA